jgi:hypothetical protein
MSVSAPAHTYPPSSLAPTSIRVPRVADRILAWVKRQLPSLNIRDLLPIGFEVHKAVTICGNASTPSLLILECQKAAGVAGVVPVSLLPIERSD